MGKRTGARPVAFVLVLTALTLSVYFYVYVYGWLRRAEQQAEEDAWRSAARRARAQITLGLGLQFVAFLVVLLALFPVLSNPGDLDALLRGLGEAHVTLPSGVRIAESVATFGNWAGWIVFWVGLLGFLVGRLDDAGLPRGAAGFALALLGIRVLAGGAGLAGAAAVESSFASLDAVLYLVLVGCAASAIEALAVASVEVPTREPTD